MGWISEAGGAWWWGVFLPDSHAEKKKRLTQVCMMLRLPTATQELNTRGRVSSFQWFLQDLKPPGKKQQQKQSKEAT